MRPASSRIRQESQTTYAPTRLHRPGLNSFRESGRRPQAAEPQKRPASGKVGPGTTTHATQHQNASVAPVSAPHKRKKARPPFRAPGQVNRGRNDQEAGSAGTQRPLGRFRHRPRLAQPVIELDQVRLLGPALFQGGVGLRQRRAGVLAFAQLRQRYRVSEVRGQRRIGLGHAAVRHLRQSVLLLSAAARDPQDQAGS